MKRWIHAVSDVDIDKYSTIAEIVDQTEVDSDIAQLVVEADESGMLEAFASKVTTSKLIIDDDNKITVGPAPNEYGKIRADFSYKPLRKGQETASIASVWLDKVDLFTPKQLARKLVSDMRKNLRVYYKRYQDSLTKSALKDKYNTGTTQLISAFSVACRYVKKYAKLTPTFRYSDSGKAEYMLWSLPGVEREPVKLDMKALEAHEVQFKEAIKKFEEDTGVSCYAYCPHGGNYVRSAFTLQVDPKIQLVYDKETDTYSQV